MHYNWYCMMDIVICDLGCKIVKSILYRPVYCNNRMFYIIINVYFFLFISSFIFGIHGNKTDVILPPGQAQRNLQ